VRVIAIVAVVAQNEVVVVPDFYLTEVVVGRLIEVRLIQSNTIDIHRLAFYLYCVAGQSNDALYIIGIPVIGGAEHDHLAPLGFAETIDDFANQQPLPWFEIGLHAGAYYNETLDSSLQYDKNHYCHYDSGYNFAESASHLLSYFIFQIEITEGSPSQWFQYILFDHTLSSIIRFAHFSREVLEWEWYGLYETGALSG